MRHPKTIGQVVVAVLGLWAVVPLLGQTLPVSGARVVSLTGTLSVIRSRQAPQALKLYDPVMAGDELITGENSYATLQTSTGATVRVFPDSRIRFSEHSADIQEFLHLFFGSIKVHIERLTGRPNPHRMTTPTAVIAVRGTTFSVFVDENNSTLVAVDEGVVSVANIRFPNQEVILHGGQRTWVHEGQPPMQVQAFRGRSERADLAPSRTGPRGTGGAKGSMPAGMKKKMEKMRNSRDMGNMGGMGTMSGHSGGRH